MNLVVSNDKPVQVAFLVVSLGPQFNAEWRQLSLKSGIILLPLANLDQGPALAPTLAPTWALFLSCPPAHLYNAQLGRYSLCSHSEDF